MSSWRKQNTRASSCNTTRCVHTNHTVPKCILTRQKAANVNSIPASEFNTTMSQAFQNLENEFLSMKYIPPNQEQTNVMYKILCRDCLCNY